MRKFLSSGFDGCRIEAIACEDDFLDGIHIHAEKFFDIGVDSFDVAEKLIVTKLVIFSEFVDFLLIYF